MLNSLVIALNILLVLLIVSGIYVSGYMIVVAVKRETLLIRRGGITDPIALITLKRTRRAEIVYLVVHLMLLGLNVYSLHNELRYGFRSFCGGSMILRALVSTLLQYLSIRDYHDRARILRLKRRGF